MPATVLPATQPYGSALGWGASRGGPPLTRVLKVTPVGNNSSSNNSSTVLMSRELIFGAGPSPGGSPGMAAVAGADAAVAAAGGGSGAALSRRPLPPLAPYQGLTTTRCVSVKVGLLFMKIDIDIKDLILLSSMHGAQQASGGRVDMHVQYVHLPVNVDVCTCLPFAMLRTAYLGQG